MRRHVFAYVLFAIDAAIVEFIAHQKYVRRARFHKSIAERLLELDLVSVQKLTPIRFRNVSVVHNLRPNLFMRLVAIHLMCGAVHHKKETTTHKTSTFNFETAPFLVAKI